jgi:tRNA-specific 2-thiouridylase
MAVQKKGACCAGQDIHDARRVAEQIGIPHYVLDYEDRFREAVIEDFADSYAAGETPIPCIRCNERVKFRDLLETARDLGAAALATGHYIATKPGANGHRELHRPRDDDRDQSYFLFTTTQDQLDYLRFPLGDLTKPEARAIAERMGLHVAAKPDSQDICFVPTGRYTTIVDRLRPNAAMAGEIVHLDGRVLGRHEGITRFTIGQRRGLGIGAAEPNTEPLFVVGLDPARKQVIVPAGGLNVLAKVRSTRPPVPARLFVESGAVEVELANGEEGVSPGQACVFYGMEDEGSRVLGGGWIAKAFNPVLETLRVAENMAQDAAAR